MKYDFFNYNFKLLKISKENKSSKYCFKAIAFDQAKKEAKILEEVIKESEDYLQKKKGYYQKKGYSDAWIEKSLKSIEIRNELESIWQKNGISKTRHFAILPISFLRTLLDCQ